MYRKVSEYLKQWKESPYRKPLLLQGARQVGKTWLMKEFGRTSFANIAYINFDNNRRMRILFEDDYDLKRIITALQIESGVKIIIALGKGIIKSIPSIIENAGSIVKAILDVIQAVDWLNLGASVIKGIGSGIKSLATHIPELLKQVAKAAWDGFLNMEWGKLGSDIIAGIASGVRGAAASIASAARQAASDALASAKKLLGIHSPSKVFRDEVGKMIGLGMAEGIGDSTRPISEALDDVTSKMSAGLDPITVSGSFDAGSMAKGGSMEQLLALVAGLSAKIDRIEIRLDGDRLVGGISDKMNKALGDQSALEARGVA